MIRKLMITTIIAIIAEVKDCKVSKLELEHVFGREDFYNRLAGFARKLKVVFELRGDTIYFWPQ